MGSQRMAGSPSRYERTRCVRRGWVLERVGWVAMALIAICGALGFFGGGWLSRAEARAGDGLAIEYMRYARVGAPLEMVVDWVPQQQPTLWVARPYLDAFAVEEIRPTPAAVTAAADRIYYEFRALEPQRRVHVTFTLEPKKSGAVRGRIGAGELDVEVRQFVFP
jgi:hypothetical protein